MYTYGKRNKYEECECDQQMNSHNWKKDDKLDDILDLLKKILKEKKEKHDHDDKKDKKPYADIDVVTVTFDLDDHEVEFVSPAEPYGCVITPNVTTITAATHCLLNKGFKIATYVAAFDGAEGALGTYTFVRSR